ncbi:MAG: YheU family protein [Myxococcales bacterium]|nr:YheU family protein [Myxococcales bacterium]
MPIPPEALTEEALRGLVQEFVTRDGTDYGAVERSIEEKTAEVRRLLASGEARVVFDPGTETANIVLAADLDSA